MPSFGLPSARAEASRRNGAKSCGPKTPEGKTRSAQNALKHGFRAQKHIVLPSEDAAAFEALEAALIEELAPDGALQSALAQRVVVRRLAARTRRAAGGRPVRREPACGLEPRARPDPRLQRRARSFDTLLRYRGGALAELWRALRTLKALQAERAAANPQVIEPHLLAEPHEIPIEPEARGNPRDPEPAPVASEPVLLPAAIVPAVLPCDRAARTQLPDEPESRADPRESGRSGGRAAPGRGDPRPAEPAPARPIELARRGSACLLAGTALVPPGRRGSS